MFGYLCISLHLSLHKHPPEMRPWQVKVTLYDIRACSAITNKIFFTGTNKVMQGKNGGKADESEISRTVTCDGHCHPHSSRVAWGLDDMWGFGRCHTQKYFTMQIRASDRWCCRIFEHFSEVHAIYPKLENILVQNILFLIAEQALSIRCNRIFVIRLQFTRSTMKQIFILDYCPISFT